MLSSSTPTTPVKVFEMSSPTPAPARHQAPSSLHVQPVSNRQLYMLEMSIPIPHHCRVQQLTKSKQALRTVRTPQIATAPIRAIFQQRQIGHHHPIYSPSSSPLTILSTTSLATLTPSSSLPPGVQKSFGNIDDWESGKPLMEQRNIGQGSMYHAWRWRPVSRPRWQGASCDALFFGDGIRAPHPSWASVLHALTEYTRSLVSRLPLGSVKHLLQIRNLGQRPLA